MRHLAVTLECKIISQVRRLQYIKHQSVIKEAIFLDQQIEDMDLIFQLLVKHIRPRLQTIKILSPLVNIRTTDLKVSYT